MRSIFLGGDLELDFALQQKGKKAQIVDYAWVAADELPVCVCCLLSTVLVVSSVWPLNVMHGDKCTHACGVILCDRRSILPTKEGWNIYHNY